MTAGTIRVGPPGVRARLIAWSARSGVYGSLVLGAVCTLLPLVVVLMASLKTGSEFRASGPFDLPGSLTLDNYVEAFRTGRMASGFVNTTILLAFSLTGTVIVGSAAAYAIERFRFPGRRAIVVLFLLASLVPSVTTQVATFRVVNELGLFNTRRAAIALFLGTDVIAIYIFRQFIRGIPSSLDEAARLDGASYAKVYRSIILPLLKPAIATVAIIKGVAIYNEFYIPFLYMPDRDLGTVSTSLFRFKGPYGTQWEIISAGVMLAIIPTLIAFLLLQRLIYNGFARGATK